MPQQTVLCNSYRWSLGYRGGALHFVDNTTLVYGCGNILTFVSHSGKHVRSLSSEGSGVGPIAVCPRTSTDRLL